MTLEERMRLMAWLGDYLKSGNEDWRNTVERAHQKNSWFTPEFVEDAADAIADNYLDNKKLDAWVKHYHLDDNIEQKKIGIVMAGNIPMVGFHDFLCVFISGHKQLIKFSEKDDVLLKHLINVLRQKDSRFIDYVSIADQLKDCDAYIATGSNNTGIYFEKYFGRYPHIIRKNKTSVAVLDGSETKEELEKLSDDIHRYYGFGCRSITKLFVPEGYDFVPLIKAFDKYAEFADNHKFKNNYDYQLSLLLLNNQKYMTNGSTLLSENERHFSPIAHVYYQFYGDAGALKTRLEAEKDLQCIEGHAYLPFGNAQSPGLFDYADGVDTMQFLLSL